MRVRARAAARQSTKRRWRIPPPLVLDGSGPGPEGLWILDEIRSELGAVLWKTHRSVTMWADSEPPSRRHLFDEGAADRRQLEILSTVPEDASRLREALEDLLPILVHPDEADPEFTGLACTRIAAWAEKRQAPRTQLEFLQAAALCCPANPAFALAIGRNARNLAQYAKAESWYYRTIGLARQAGDWETYVTAYLSHGTMMFRRGALPAARRSVMKALRRGRRQGLRQCEADALHDLFVLEAVSGNREAALARADEALEAHGSPNVGIPRLAHDIAYFWLEQGDYRYALPVFVESLGKVSPETRPAGLGSMSRAAAGVGDQDAYEWARTELREYSPGPNVAEAWVDVARAAMSLDRHDEAEEAARLAESVARARREGRIRFLAESVMEQVSAERQAAAALARHEQVEHPTNNILARKLIRALQSSPPAALVGQEA